MTVEYMSLDPGVTTGVATYGDGKYQAWQMRPGNYSHPHEMLYDMMCNVLPKTVIYEAFHFRQGMDGAVFTGVEYIGIIELYSQLKYSELIKITPSDGKGFWDNKKLAAIGVYQKGLPHGMDAMRILLRHRMKAEPGFMNTVLPLLKENL